MFLWIILSRWTLKARETVLVNTVTSEYKAFKGQPKSDVCYSHKQYQCHLLQLLDINVGLLLQLFHYIPGFVIIDYSRYPWLLS